MPTLNGTIKASTISLHGLIISLMISNIELLCENLSNILTKG